MANWGVLAILGFQVFCPATSSMVNVNAGGYDDIVIAIHPGVPEDERIIEKIQTLVKEATHVLFNATKQRLFIRSAKILIPLTWSQKEIYTNRSREKYEKADVIIGNTFLNIGDDPYTMQYGACGEHGQYIHFTPNFLLQENLISVYGPHGKVFVHQWARLRWGVFEEYYTEHPYYISEKFQLEATRCAVDLNGTYRMTQHMENSCVTRACNIDPDTGLFEQGCTFFPDSNQFARESIMYSPGLQSVSEFCDETNHNIEAPTMHNRMCNCHSTWDIIKNSSDIALTAPRDDVSIPEPSFSLLQYRQRVITLLLDVSGSMATNNRFWRLHQAADVFLTQIIASGTYIGLVEFSMYSFILSELQQITGEGEREILKSRLPSTPSNYDSDFCSGIRNALKVNGKLYRSLHGTEIIFIADGDDSRNTSLCYPEIESSGAIIHVIALSPAAAKKLEQIADMTGGLKYFATDGLESNDLIDAFVGISNENGDFSLRTNQLESTSTSVTPGECLRDTVFIDSTVGAETFFTVLWQFSVPSIQLEDPAGKSYSTEKFTTTNSCHLSRLKIPEIATSGTWSYTLCNTFTSIQALGIMVTSQAADVNVAPITVAIHMNKDTNIYPSPMVVYASVSQGLLLVKGANVTAVITPESGNPTILELLDNGAGADIAKDDGIYSKYFFTFNVNGRYGLKVRVEGNENEARLTHPKNRVFQLPGFVENGKVVLNPSRSSATDVLPALGSFSRTAAGGSFMVSGVINTVIDVYQPGKITDLEAKVKGSIVVLSWTATGDDLDSGTAQSYELRMNKDVTELRDNFERSTLVDISGLKPNTAGSRVIFTFTPDHVTENGTILYFALIAVDKNLQKSVPSNIARAVWVPPSLRTTVLPVTKCPTRKRRVCATTKYIQVCDPKSTPAPKQATKCPTKPLPKCTTAK
ncbi:calcium-activated chloride channel regulator 1-like [Mixophyes fleayi]|uniref:calcium-activated chloride channel regulator 1-like n=1 Tax=Mixophyes fleayi TaxID=3061075 RepID=UPI003F4E1EF9